MITCYDIGGTTIKAATATGPNALTAIGRVPTPHDDFEAFAAAMAGLIEQGGAPAGRPISISVTGVVDPETGVTTVANIPCIDGRNLAGDLGARLGRAVLVANDADCFALAEAHAGAGQGHRVVFGAILGTGVGGGIVADGRLFRHAERRIRYAEQLAARRAKLQPREHMLAAIGGREGIRRRQFGSRIGARETDRAGVIGEEMFQPGDRLGIEMVGGLVQQQQIRMGQQQSAQSHPTSLSTGKG